MNATDSVAKEYFYEEIPSYYRFVKGILKDNVPSKWQKRKQNTNCIARIYSVNPANTELFNLRILLLRVKGATCFEDLKMVNGKLEPTFTAACPSHGFIKDDKELDKALLEASLSAMPMQLRQMFVRILIHCNVVKPLDLWNKYKIELSDDFNDNEQLRFIKAYNEINKILKEENRSLNDFITLKDLYPFVDDSDTIDLNGFNR